MSEAAPRPDLALVRRARRIDRTLAQTYPEAGCELDFANPFQLLIATILSAQTTDKRVNAVTPFLFDRWPDAPALAGADRTELEEMLRPLGFFRAKANSITGAAAALTENHAGQVPADLTALVKLSGVGRKTANVVLGNAFDVPGITVDTHFARLVRRWAWTTQTDPVAIEHAVGALFPRTSWTMLSHRVIWHGRRRCHARRPACGACPVARDCPAYGEGETDPTKAAALVREPRG